MMVLQSCNRKFLVTLSALSGSKNVPIRNPIKQPDCDPISVLKTTNEKPPLTQA